MNEEVKEARKITRKIMNEIEKFKREIKISKSIKKTIEYDSSKLISDLNTEKGFEIEKIKKRKIKLEKVKILKTIVNIIRKSVIPERYLYHILRHKKYCA